MAVKHEDAIPVLENLVEKCHTLECTYAEVARCLTDPALKTRCISLWQERAQFARDLADKIRWIGGAIDLEESTPENFREVPLQFTKKEQDDLLAEGAEGDEEMAIEYDRALRLPLPIDVQMLLMRHRMKLKASEKAGLLDHLAHNSLHRDILAQAVHN